MAVVHQSSEGLTPASDGSLPSNIQIILDIDVIKIATVEPGSEDVWRELDSLREYKNDIFFKSLQDITLEPYI